MLNKSQKPLKRKEYLKPGDDNFGKRVGLKKSKYRLKAKKKTESEQEAIKVQQSKDKAFYEQIWRERGPYSELSGAYLGSQVNKACIDHLCEKSKYPHLRYEKDNVLMVTLDEHWMKTNGYPLPAHQEAIDRVKIKYNL